MPHAKPTSRTSAETPEYEPERVAPSLVTEVAEPVVTVGSVPPVPELHLYVTFTDCSLQWPLPVGRVKTTSVASPVHSV